MELIGFIQVFNLVVIAIGTLLYLCCGSLTFSSSSSSSGAGDAAAVDDKDDDVDIPPLPEKYDVFISFRGEDTRKTFTSHLRAAVLRKKFETYIDYKLKKGDEIGPGLLEAIEKSRLSVIIFSKNYASSTWCLIELVHILKCRKKKGQMVVPIFYNINPSDVRKQKGSYADAFAQLEKRFKDSMGKVREWRKALRTAANLSGFDYSNNKGTEADFIEEVVEDISTKLKRETSYDLRGMVGIQSRIEQVESLLSTNNWKGVCTVGIWGMGGIGKTTLAKAVFRRLSSNFDACCLLKNVREKLEQKDGVDQLQKTLLREILNEEKHSIDSTSVKEGFSRTKALIVFDDVSDSMQIKDVAGGELHYGDGSRIIVTSREWSVLLNAVTDEKYIYGVEELNTDDAFWLFQSHAFKDNSPRAEYTELSARVVKYAGGIPLALEILGSLFLPCKSKDEWGDALNKLKKFPSKKIQNVFRISYDLLQENEQEIFLDIACFYKGYRIEHVKKMVDFGQMHGGLCAADGIRVLRDRSLITIDSEWETIDMHDLVQEMGWAIVRKQCLEEPGRRNRLFLAGDVYHVLKNNTGTEKVQAIHFNWSDIGSEQNLDRADFENMQNLRLLNVDSSSLVLRNSPFYYFETYGEYFPNLTLSLPSSLRYLFWKGYPLKSLPPKFSPDNLVELHMPYITRSSVELWNGGQNLVNLKVIDLRYSKRLTALPNLSRSPNIEHIDLSGCESLVKIPPHFKNLDKLTYLDLSDCKSLEYLPEMPGNIEFLCLRGSGIRELSSVWSHEKKFSSLDIGFCEKLKKLPSSSCKLRVSGAFSLAGCNSLGNFWELPRDIGELDLSSTAIEVFPTSSMECLLRLTTLKLKNCKNLASLPTSICKLKSLEVLDLTGCTGFYEFPEILEPMEHLKFLCLEATAVEALTQSAGNLIGLQTLDLGWCKKLKAVPSSIYKLTNLKTLSLIKCTSLESLPELPVEALPQSAGNLIGLQTLDLGWCKKLKAVPSSIYKLTNLKTLSLIKCMSLESLPELPVLSRLQADGCKLLKTVASSRTAITQCWNIYELLPEQLAFYNCRSMGYYDEASSNIMADAQLRIMRVATASSKLKEEEEKFSEPLVTIVCPGYKIPNWFVHQNERASINVKLPPNWFREGFLGFALSVVASDFYVKRGLLFRGKYNFKTEEGESHEINCSFYVPFEDGKNYGSTFYFRHVFVLYKDLEYEEGAKWSSAFYDRVTEVSVHSYELNRFCNVEKCGICLLYAEDAEKLKCDVMLRQEQDEPAASGSGDLEANGSDESEEASGSDDSEGESGSNESVAGPGLTYVFSTTNTI
ncbi:TMV resistance protein N-like isoform X2 [Malus domestica]|uniref:TMV resistance protein N-like isoform X2 n=1 Tax=Malus domestica TaxID=3750 RepID=UPI003974896B